jgi:hypothetical protein
MSETLDEKFAQWTEGKNPTQASVENCKQLLMSLFPTHDPKCQAWQVLDSVQFFRNFTEVKRVLPGIPTEPAQKWLAHVIVLASEKRPALRETGKTLSEKLLNWEADVDALYSNPVIQAIAVLKTPEDREVAILKLAQCCRAELLVQQLKALSIQNVDSWASDLDNAMGDDKTFQDYYIEGCYAFCFARCGFPVTLKPTGLQGPDLKLEVNGAEIYLEVSRFREDEALRWETGQSTCMNFGGHDDIDILPEMPDKSQKVLTKFEDESKQLIQGKLGIILLYSDNVVIDELEFHKAIAYKATPLAKVSAVIFGDTWRKVGASGYPVYWGLVNPSAKAQIQPSLLQKIGKCLDSNFKIAEGC